MPARGLLEVEAPGKAFQHILYLLPLAWPVNVGLQVLFATCVDQLSWCCLW